MIRVFVNHYEPAHVITQGLWTVLKWLLFGKPWNFKVSSMLCKGWSFLSWFGVELLRCEFIKSIDLIWRYIYIYIFFFYFKINILLWNNWCLNLIVMFLSFSKNQPNPVAFHCVLRGWHFTPRCFGGWRCRLGSQHVANNQNPRNLGRAFGSFGLLNAFFVWLLNLSNCYCGS